MRAVRLKSLNDSDWLVPLELSLTAHGLATTCRDQFALGILDHNFAPVRDRDRIHPFFFLRKHYDFFFSPSESVDSGSPSVSNTSFAVWKWMIGPESRYPTRK